MNIAFFCSTPYQIINAINLKQNLHITDTADIYVLKHFHSADWLIERLESVEVFNNVYAVNDADLDYRYQLPRLKRYIKKAKDFVFCKGVVNEYVNTSAVYDAIFYTFPNMIIEFACYYFIKKNKNIKFYMFEDGFSSYSDSLMAISNAKALFLKIMNRRQFLDVNHELYLYAPHLFCRTRNDKNYKVNQLPLLSTENPELCNIFNKLFELKDSDKIQQKCIFFEQPYEDMDVNKEIRESLDLIMPEIEAENLCVKLHPRGRKELYENIKQYQNSTIPMEILYQNMSDLGNRTLVSSISTACITPKLIFGREPKLILLYKYLHLQERGIITQGLVDFIEKVVASYSDKSCIMIPENNEELTACIQALENIDE